MIRSAFFSIGFRPFFASGILFGALALVIWAGIWIPQTQIHIDLIMSPVNGFHFWHPHELIMGFSLAIIIGFLLTAVRNWTGLETISSFGLFFIWLTWLFARFVMAFGDGYSINIIIVSQILPALLAAACIASPIIQKRMWRNLFAPVTLLIFALLDMAIIYQQHTLKLQPSHLFAVAIFMILFLITMIAGRVIPFFTANKLGIKKWIEPKALLLSCTLPIIILICLQAFDNTHLRLGITSIFATLLFLAHGLRLFYWHHNAIWQHPMLWSLWLSYASMPIGFLVLALEPFLHLGNIATHIFALGTLSGLIVSMVARVSLGHTGRTIAHDPMIISIIVLMLIAMLIRTLGVALIGFNVGLIIVSASFASLSLALLFTRFVMIWLTPRIK